MRYVFLYILNIVIVNYAFMFVPSYISPGGIVWTPVALLVGFIFVVRDYAQREIGHKIILAMLVGGVISWYLATPAIAVASILAFLVGEFMDWGVYTFTKKPFSQRILLSSLLSTPVDSVVFLSLIDMLSLPTLLSMTISKMLGALAVFYIVRRREITAQNMAIENQKSIE